MRVGNGLNPQHFNFSSNIHYQPTKTLTEIANQYELDKGDCLKEKLSWNNLSDHFTLGYSNVYHEYMEPYRNKATEIFEVGIADGRFMFHSIKMWLSYFMRVNIHCMDNFWGIENTKQVNERLEQLSQLGVDFYYGDQGASDTWDIVHKNIPINSIDFFIEDGSHDSIHMMHTLYESIPLVKKHGIYFMEDVQDPVETAGKYGFNNVDIYHTMNKFYNDGIFETPHLSKPQCVKIQESYKPIKCYCSSEKPIKEGLKVHMFVLEKI
jgi:hypothetical protein